PDVQDVVFFGKNRPVMIRLHVFNNGKPFSEAWDAYIQKLFKYVDRDGNGFLDAEECKKLIPPMQMQQLVRGNFYAFYNQPNTNVTLEQIDKDGDGKASLEEVKNFYNTNAQVSAMQLVSGPANYGGYPGGNQLTGSLIKHLGG